MAGPTKRKAHVKRVFRVDPDTGDVDYTIWIDVLRLDTVAFSFQTTDESQLGQIINYFFKWNDDPTNPDPNVDASNADIQFENANAKRQTRQLKIKSPHDPDDPDNPNPSALLWIVDKAKVALNGKPIGAKGQVITHVFDNINDYTFQNVTPPYDDFITSETRQATVLSISSNDLAGLAMQDSEGNPILVDWEDYKRAMQDENAHIDDNLSLTIEVVDQFKVSFQANESSGLLGQGIKYVLTQNAQLEPGKELSLDPPLFALGDPQAVDVNGNPCVIRTDPLQAIVNMGGNIIAVEFEKGDF